MSAGQQQAPLACILQVSRMVRLGSFAHHLAPEMLAAKPRDNAFISDGDESREEMRFDGTPSEAARQRAFAARGDGRSMPPLPSHHQPLQSTARAADKSGLVPRATCSLINALSSSIIPVLNSFLILLLIGSVYAVIATDLFGAYDSENFGVFSR